MLFETPVLIVFQSP